MSGNFAQSFKIKESRLNKLTDDIAELKKALSGPLLHDELFDNYVHLLDDIMSSLDDMTLPLKKGNYQDQIKSEINEHEKINFREEMNGKLAKRMQ